MVKAKELNKNDLYYYKLKSARYIIKLNDINNINYKCAWKYEFNVVHDFTNRNITNLVLNNALLKLVSKISKRDARALKI